MGKGLQTVVGGGLMLGGTMLAATVGGEAINTMTEMHSVAVVSCDDTVDRAERANAFKDETTKAFISLVGGTGIAAVGAGLVFMRNESQ